MASSSLTDIKHATVTAIKGLTEFASYQDDVWPFRDLEPETASEQAASKCGDLSAFVSIERVFKGQEDYDPQKEVTVVTDIWIKIWGEQGQGDEPEDLLAGAIVALESLTTESWGNGGPCDHKQRLAFQDAFRVVEAPKPYLVYRIITQTQTVLGE